MCSELRYVLWLRNLVMKRSTKSTVISSTRLSLLPYLGKSPSISKSVTRPSSLRIGLTCAYLIADKESAATDNPAIPVAIVRIISVSCKAISRRS